MQKFKALSPLRDAGYNNRGRANTLLNKYQPDTSKCKVKVTLEDSSTKWVEVSKGVFFYWDYMEFGGTYALQKLVVEVV
jgi:hypothetical protein